MKTINLVILIFLLGAFAIGITLQDVNQEAIEDIFSNVSDTINNITLTTSIPEHNDIPNIEGLFNVLEKYIHFVGTLAIEIFKTGVNFGQENPDYFEPENILLVIKWIIWLVIIGLLIKPAGYVIIFFVIGFMYFFDRIKSRRSRKQ